jgi:hypothetical protein
MSENKKIQKIHRINIIHTTIFLEPTHCIAIFFPHKYFIRVHMKFFKKYEYIILKIIPGTRVFIIKITRMIF